MDAVMYLFRENTTFRRWIPDRVAFMNCLFAEQIIGEYRKFLAFQEVQAPKDKKHLKVVPYSVLYTPMKPKINKSQNDCGVYALKFIECHLFGHSFTMLDDENIKMARLKIVCDLWHAAQDPVLIERMSRYEPTPATESEIVEL
ncbi:hypothetical protein EUTSA_v10003081mg [Eutrema salsugineum]|uniref:Ubiquitin-like protease family profile domain-containing protein n=1 Tax=Eutrema salsugineum TaxID=72664 RepID=V4KGF7_EUTSA|nr:hypothetical protein EUTSA_v10003081mg [Eutrema salsugineum]